MSKKLLILSALDDPASIPKACRDDMQLDLDVDCQMLTENERKLSHYYDNKVNKRARKTNSCH